MTFLEAPKASFLVAEKLESLVFSLTKALAVGNLELKGNLVLILLCQTVLDCSSPLSPPYAEVAF